MTGRLRHRPRAAVMRAPHPPRPRATSARGRVLRGARAANPPRPGRTGSWPARSRERFLSAEAGQASVEFVALLPLLALVLAAAWQFVLAGDAVWHARVAARAAARAQAVGADPGAAALAHLPARLEHALRVRVADGGDVRVSIRVPAVLGALDLGRVSASAHFEAQGA